VGIFVTGFFVVLAGLISFVPTPLARWVITAQLEALGVEHDGIKTVDIDVWSGEVFAGPLSFRSGETQDGQIGAAGFTYSFGAVFRGRAFLQTFFLRGVDIHVARRTDGAVTINGVALGQSDDTKADEPEPPDPAGTPRDLGVALGIEQFEFTDSRLVFEDVTGGALTIDIDQLTLERLFTWTPEEPAQFALEGTVNDIQLSLDGTVTPFLDPLRFTLNTRLRGITIDRVARFVGSTDLAREDGTLDSESRYDYVVYRDGRVEGSVNGTYRFSDFAIATTEGETLGIDAATLELDLDQKLQADGSATAKGNLSLSATSINVANALGDSASIAAAGMTFRDLSLDKSALRRETFFEYGTPTDGSASTDNTAAGLITLMIGWARDLALETLTHQLTFDGKSTLNIEDAQLSTAARGDTPGRSLRLNELQLDLGTINSEAFDGGFRVRLGLESALNALAVAVADGGPRADIDDLRLAASSIDLSATRGMALLELDIQADLKTISASDGQGATVALDMVSLGSDGFKVVQNDRSGEAAGPLSVRLEALEASRPNGADEIALHGEGLQLTLDQFSMTSEGSGAARFTGDMALDGVSLARTGDKPLTLTLASKRSELSNISISPLGAEATIEGALTTVLTDIALEGFLTGAPAERDTRATARLDGLDISVSGFKADSAAVLAEGDIRASVIAMATDEPTPQRFDIASVSIAGLKIGNELGLNVDEVAIDALVATLKPPPLGDGKAENKPEPETADTVSSSAGSDSQPAPIDAGARSGPLIAKPEQPIRLGTFRISPGSRIELADETTETPFKANIRLEELTLGPLDSDAPDTKTNVAFAATINETASVNLTGWLSPFRDMPALELNSGLDGLNLPVLSLYTAQAVGVNIESGDLTAKASANTSQENLSGQIDVRVDDLFVVPVSEKEAERLKANVGLPVGFAVGVLKDKDGVIELGFPVSGNVANPQIDFSEAINKAISGALASIFPTNWFGKDGNDFTMQPAEFAPGTTELTDAGKAEIDRIGDLVTGKTDITVRACGRGAHDDLVALRGVPEAPASPPAKDQTATARNSDQTPAAKPAGEAVPVAVAPKEILPPNDREVAALLALATERGERVRDYLAQEHGIDPKRVPQCRTTYSIDDGKPPRAEFQF
jgi:hypothetical protein